MRGLLSGSNDFYRGLCAILENCALELVAIAIQTSLMSGFITQSKIIPHNNFFSLSVLECNPQKYTHTRRGIVYAIFDYDNVIQLGDYGCRVCVYLLYSCRGRQQRVLDTYLIFKKKASSTVYNYLNYGHNLLLRFTRAIGPLWDAPPVYELTSKYLSRTSTT